MPPSRWWRPLVVALLVPAPLHAGAVLHEFATAGNAIVLAFSPDGSLLAAPAGGVLHVWDTRTGKEVRRIPEESGAGVWTVAFAADGRTVFTPLADGSVAGWSVATGKRTHRFEGHSAVVWCLAVSPDGRLLASASEDQTVRLWDAATGKELRRLDHGCGVWPVGFAPDGRTLASATSEGTLFLWDVGTGRERGRFAAEAGAWPVLFGPDGHTLAAVRWQGTEVRLWDRAGREQRTFEIAGGAGWNLAFSPDGRTLAASGPGDTVRLFESATGLERLRLAGHRAAVDAVAFAPDGRAVAGAGRDGRVLLWDVTGRAAPGRHPAPVALTDRDLGRLCDDLAGADASRAYRALWALAAVPGPATPLLARRARAAAGPRADPGRVARLIAALDDDRFEEREKASRELEQLGPAVTAALRQALEANPGAEPARRLEALLERLARGGISPQALAGRRAVEALEQIGTPEARRVLEQLADEGVAPEVRDEARTSLRRLAGRPAPKP
jgi:hypothetical protein